MASITAQLIEGFEHLFGPRPDGDIVRQIDPPDRTAGINEEFGWPCNVGAFDMCYRGQKLLALSARF
jgi:hypothetical protein